MIYPIIFYPYISLYLCFLPAHDRPYSRKTCCGRGHGVITWIHGYKVAVSPVPASLVNQPSNMKVLLPLALFACSAVNAVQETPEVQRVSYYLFIIFIDLFLFELELFQRTIISKVFKTLGSNCVSLIFPEKINEFFKVKFQGFDRKCKIFLVEISK